MVRDFTYPVQLTTDAVDGGFVVTFPDIPEAITQGEDLADALVQATDALDEAVAGRVRRGEPIPAPSHAVKGQHLVAVPALTAAKAALYLRQKLVEKFGTLDDFMTQEDLQRMRREP